MRVLPVIGLCLGLAACSDPLAGVDRLAEVDVADDPVAAALPDAEEIAREGFFGTSAATGDVPEGLAEPQARGGLFRGLIRRAAQVDPADAIAADVAQSLSRDSAIEESALEEAEIAPVELAALTPEAAVEPRGLGLFGSAAKREDRPAGASLRSGPDARDVAFGEVVPFGEIARVCDAKGKPLGKQVASLGRRGFTLYDSNSSIRDQRTFYITGFADDCPRQFTAATALFGAPSFYETIRFGPAGKHLPYANTDKAYDGVKSSVCRVQNEAPCGNQIDTLDEKMAFVSAYEFGEINDSWKEFLVYDGVVLASAVKSF